MARLLRIDEDLLGRYCPNVSGGQRQRVALGRTLVWGPSAVLLDEPLSSLDTELRRELRHEIPKILKEVGITTIWVTHDPEEAFEVGDSVVMIKQGRVEDAGVPESIYSDPASPFSAEFTDSRGMKAFRALSCPRLALRLKIPGSYFVFARSEDLRIVRGEGDLLARVTGLSRVPTPLLYAESAVGPLILPVREGEAPPSVGTALGILFPDRPMVWDEENKRIKI